MPVVIEKVVSPSAQDLIDLEKLYKDYPTDLRFADLQLLLKNQPETTLYGARFNDRLLAAITVTPGPEGAILDHLCTRALTRQRGVGKELLRQLLKACSEPSFIFTSCIDSPVIAHLFIQAGFSQNGLAFTLQR
jgi:hypothetical protein